MKKSEISILYKNSDSNSGFSIKKMEKSRIAVALSYNSGGYQIIGRTHDVVLSHALQTQIRDENFQCRLLREKLNSHM